MPSTDLALLTIVWATGSSTWVGISIEATTLPDDVVPLIRIHAGGVEIVNSQQSWQRGDEVIVMTRLPAEETRALLSAPVAVAGREEAQA